jgi:hypothetical protein
MSQDNKSGYPDQQKHPAEPIEARAEKKRGGTKAVEAQIWAAANQLTRDADEPFEEEQ